MNEKITQTENILKKLDLQPLTSPKIHFKDKTVRSYFSQVVDQKGKKFFIKINPQFNRVEFDRFCRSYGIGQLLKKNRPPFYKYTPMLISGAVNKRDGYLLYEYIEAENMGSRSQYDFSRFDKGNYQAFILVAKAFHDLPIKGLSGDRQLFRHLDLLSVIKQKLTFLDDKLFDVMTKAEGDYHLKEITKLLNSLKPKNNLIHGDLQSPNFIKHKNNLYLVDFDLTAIGDPSYDYAYFCLHLVRKPTVRSFYQRKILAGTSDDFINTFSIYSYVLCFIQILALIKTINLSTEVFNKAELDFRAKMIKNRLIELDLWSQNLPVV